MLIENGTIVIKDKTMHLVYSEDDNGYYWERNSDFQTSQIFPTGKAAIIARQNNTIEGTK